MVEIASAIEYLHSERVIHGDIRGVSLFIYTHEFYPLIIIIF
jgi:serine/threonine protein kinase